MRYIVLSLAVIGCVPQEETVDDPAGDVDLFDDALAAEIAHQKQTMLGVAEIEPHAAPCATAGPTGSARRVDDAAYTGAAKQRSGSSTGCLALGVLQPSDDANYFCFTFATSTESWTYAENLRTHVRGWTRDDLLRGRGSFTYCGF